MLTSLLCLFQSQNNEIVFQCKHGFKPNYVADANGHIHLVSYQDSKVDDTSHCNNCLRTCCLACAQSTDTDREKADLSVLTNKCCRYMFPIAFAIFNLVYWLALST